MARLTLTSFLTLDGVMQAPGGPDEDRSGDFQHGGWLVPHFDADMGVIMVDIFSRASAFLIGRGTYDIFAAHWPRVTDPADPIASKLNALPKYVASTTRSEFDWSNTHHLAEVPGGIAAVKDQLEGELQVHGSHGLAQTLIEHDLIDEYRLFVFPVVLGTGKRLFGSLSAPKGFALMGARSLSKGAIYQVYRPGPEFRTGSFALKEDSP